MAEWWQSPAYEARKAAGEVVTPGLVDWGGMGNDIYKFLQAPYEARVAREAAATRTPEPPSMMDPIELYRQAGYAAQPRFSTVPRVSASPKVWQDNTIPGPTPVAKTQDRLAPTPVGLPLDVPAGPNYGGYKAAPRFSTADLQKAGPDYRGYVATPRFGTASSGSDIIDLSTLDLSDRGAQNTADSEGKPVRTKTGVYYPGGKGPVAASGSAPRAPGAAPARSGGLLGGLFGGGNGGGLFSGMLGNSAPRTQAVAQPTSGPAIYTPQGNVHPGSFYDNSGNDMAFMPQSYQDNPRNSNGGY